MLNHINELILMGGVLGAIGTGMIVWPRAVLEMSQDADGNPMRVTQGNVVWMRVAGVALLALAASLIVAGIVGVPGDPDPVLI